MRAANAAGRRRRRGGDGARWRCAISSNSRRCHPGACPRGPFHNTLPWSGFSEPWIPGMNPGMTFFVFQRAADHDHIQTDRRRYHPQELPAGRRDAPGQDGHPREGSWRLAVRELGAVAGKGWGYRLCAPRQRLQAGRGRLDPRQHDPRMGLCRHGRPVRRRCFLGHLSHRFRQTGRIPRQRQPHDRDLRRGRRAARQGSGMPRALPDACARSWSSTWRACAISPIRWSSR